MILLTVLTYIAGISLLLYCLLGTSFFIGFACLKPQITRDKRSVSIVIAARNEGHNLPLLIQQLVEQEYPKELFEIIIADDGSTDNSRFILQQFAQQYSNFSWVEVNNRDEVISPKKNALTQAIKLATGDIILTTDADCLVGPQWVQSMVANFVGDTALVAGFSRTKIDNWKTAPFLHKYEYFDIIVTMMMMAASYIVGRPYACIGQNLAYTKEAFDKVGGFSKIMHLISGDDVNLLQLMAKAGMKTRFNFLPNSFAFTQSIKSWKQLFNQRSRWNSNLKWQLFLNPKFVVVITMVFSVYGAGFLLFAFDWKTATIFLGTRIFFETLLIYTWLPLFGAKRSTFRLYPFWVFAQPMFNILVLVMGQFNLFQWQGKRAKHSLKEVTKWR